MKGNIKARKIVFWSLFMLAITMLVFEIIVWARLLPQSDNYNILPGFVIIFLCFLGIIYSYLHAYHHDRIKYNKLASVFLAGFVILTPICMSYVPTNRIIPSQGTEVTIKEQLVWPWTDRIFFQRGQKWSFPFKIDSKLGPLKAMVRLSVELDPKNPKIVRRFLDQKLKEDFALRMKTALDRAERNTRFFFSASEIKFFLGWEADEEGFCVKGVQIVIPQQAY